MNSTSKLLLALGLVAPQVTLAAGFQVSEHNARATGRAGAVIATVDDASAVFYNPAGLTGVKGNQVLLGLTLLRPISEYEGSGPPGVGGPAGTYTTTGDFVPVPNIYLGRELSSKAFVGFGFYAPYGLGIEWSNPDTFVGRTVVETLSLRTFFFTPSIALKLADNVSIGVSVSLVPATVYLKQTLGATDNLQPLFPSTMWGSEGRIELSGSGFGVGANAGIQATFLDNLKVGFSFRSAVGIDFTGNADFQIPEGVPASIKANFPDGPVNAEVTLPHSFALGIGWVDGPLVIEAGANLTLWESYDKLQINFESGLPSPSSASPRNWTASPTFRLGGEYALDLGGMKLPLRAGVYYDLTPAPDSTVDFTLPDNDRFAFSVGAGLNFAPFNVDLGYSGILVMTRENTSSVNAPGGGTYVGNLVHVMGVSAGVTFE